MFHINFTRRRIFTRFCSSTTTAVRSTRCWSIENQLSVFKQANRSRLACRIRRTTFWRRFQPTHHTVSVCGWRIGRSTSIGLRKTAFKWWTIRSPSRVSSSTCWIRNRTRTSRIPSSRCWEFKEINFTRKASSKDRYKIISSFSNNEKTSVKITRFFLGCSSHGKNLYLHEFQILSQFHSEAGKIKKKKNMHFPNICLEKYFIVWRSLKSLIEYSAEKVQDSEDED